MRYRSIAGAFAGTALALFLASAAARAEGPGGAKPGPGDVAPAFTAQDLKGKDVGTEAVLKSGGIILLNFWGVRCGNCLTEIGYLNPLYDRYAPKGAVFLGVNADGAPADVLERMIPKMPNIPTYPVIADPEMKIPDLYNLAGAPLSIIIGRNGKVTWRHDDFKEGDEKEIEKALNEALAAK